MKETKIINSIYDTNNLSEMKEAYGEFASAITKAILTKDFNSLKELCCKNAIERENCEDIKFTKDYFYGMCFAYEHLGRKIFQCENEIQETDNLIKNNPMLKDIILALREKDFLSLKELSKEINTNTKTLENFLERVDIRKTILITFIKVGDYNRYIHLTDYGRKWDI